MNPFAATLEHRCDAKPDEWDVEPRRIPEVLARVCVEDVDVYGVGRSLAVECALLVSRELVDPICVGDNLSRRGAPLRVLLGLLFGGP